MPSADSEEHNRLAGKALDKAKSVQADVARALKRETFDGKGDEDPGPSDWNGFATEGVEKESE